MFAATSFANAGPFFFSGNTLLDMLKGTDDMRRLMGWGYVLGVYDNNNLRYCTSGGLTTLQMSDIVAGYLEKNPAQRNQPAHGLASKAFEEAFPCSKGN